MNIHRNYKYLPHQIKLGISYLISRSKNVSNR